MSFETDDRLYKDERTMSTNGEEDGFRVGNEI